MLDTSIIRVNPLTSLFTSICNWILFRIHFPQSRTGSLVTMKDGAEFEIFRHVVVGSIEPLGSEVGSLFIVRFRLAGMSVESNRFFSLLPIPFFIGLPGFRAKFWCMDRETGWNMGIYQWRTERDAANYARSFAVRFMTKRSETGSVSFEIINDSNICWFIDAVNKKNAASS